MGMNRSRLQATLKADSASRSAVFMAAWARLSEQLPISTAHLTPVSSMPTTVVDDRGSVLYYEDSGVPGTSTDYITLVLIHGTCFHGGASGPSAFCLRNGMISRSLQPASDP